ncbi:MAG TPA: MotA/TolQ/ExbB proton channel family protein [Oligoflexia bacterium]|nr:MotA/TolQ/ExbB proton channel family protein [Oligoflexia bacterium]
MSIFELIKTGGWVMVPLLICSVVVWAIVVERALALRRWSEQNREFLLSFTNAWLKGDREAAQKLCQTRDLDIAQVAREFLSDKVPARDLVARAERKRLERAQELRRFLWILGTIGSASPFIGLFGTVVGIIKSFQAMAESGTGGFAVVAAGISEALVATAAGIFVAVIALFFYNMFQVRIGKLQFQLKLLTEELTENVTSRSV